MEEKSVESFLGRSVEDVQNIYNKIRIVVRDDEYYVVTMDYQEDRLNLEIENGIVTAAYWG